MAELSGIEIIPLIREIEETLRGSYVNNVFSIGVNQAVRFRRPAGTDAWLLLSSRHGAWISAKVSSRTETTGFTSKLRSEIERLRFSGAMQADLDRVFYIALGEGERARRLILELIPPGNIIVVDRDAKVLLSLNERGRRRGLRRGDIYTPPSSTKLSPSDVTSQRLSEFLSQEKTLGAALGRRIALPKKYVREVLGRVGLAESSRPEDALGVADKIAAEVAGVVSEATSKPSPCLARTPDGEELFAVAPRSFAVVKAARTVSSLCDDLFTEALEKESVQEPTDEERWRQEAQVTIGRLRSQEREMVEKARGLRLAAEKARSSPSLEGALEILDGEAPKRDVRKAPGSVEAVSSVLYSLAKEAEGKAVDAAKAADSLSRKRPPTGLAHGKKTSRLAMRRGEWFERFRWFMTSGGKLAVGGRDAQSNSMLIRRHLEEDDTVYHADLFGSPFFVLKKGREQTTEETLEVAQATVAFSSAWKTGLGAADAFWVTKDQVGTSAPSGEFLAKGSFMIKGKKNPVAHNTVQLAVGLDGTGRLVAGPEAALSASSGLFVVLEPHREKASETAKRVARELSRLRGGEGPTVDEVLRVLPSGGGRITRTGPSRGEDKRK